MAKVGLTVVTYKDNFGSALQTYATQYVVRKNGYETSIFDISKLHRSIKVRKILYYCSRLIHTDERRYVFDNAKSSMKKCHNTEPRSFFDKYRKETSKIKVSLFENCCIKFICINL